jgi:hypothetical protein
MKITPPTKTVFWLSVALAGLGLLGRYVDGLPLVSAYHYYFVLVGYGILFLGNVLKGF